MINAIPVLGWLLSFIFTTSAALPFWIVWTLYGIGAKYAYWLPEVYLNPGFWECVGIFMAMSIIKAVFVPKFVTVNNSSESKTK